MSGFRIIFKRLAIVMVILVGCIIIFSFIAAIIKRNFSMTAEIWYWGSYFLSLIYFIFFLFIFRHGLIKGTIKYQNDNAGAIIFNIAILSVLFLFLSFWVAKELFRVKFLYVLPSVLLAWGLFFFDILTLKKLKVIGEWKDTFGDALSLDFSVAMSLFVVLLYCIIGEISFTSSCKSDLFNFAAGSSAFCLLISTTTFSYNLIYPESD
jgi:hypothetical protein